MAKGSRWLGGRGIDGQEEKGKKALPEKKELRRSQEKDEERRGQGKRKQEKEYKSEGPAITPPALCQSHTFTHRVVQAPVLIFCFFHTCVYKDITVMHTC